MGATKMQKTDLVRIPQPEEANPFSPSRQVQPNSLYVGQPIAYNVNYHTQICRTCGTYHSFNQVSLLIAGPKHRIHRAVGKLEFNLPIHIHHNDPEYVPVCLECAATVTLSHLPAPPPPPEDRPPVPRWRVIEGKAQKVETKPKSTDPLDFI